MNALQRIAKNTFSLLLSNIVAQLLGFIVIVYLARILGPGDFGKINFSIAIVIYFTLVGNLGLPLLGTREIARDISKTKYYLGNILVLRLCLALIGFSLLLLIVIFMNKPTEIKYLILIYGLGLIPSALLIDWVFKGIEKMEYIGLGLVLKNGIYLGLVLWFVKSSEKLFLIPCFQVSSNLLIAGFLIFIFAKGFGRLKLYFDLIFWQSLLKEALPIGLGQLMIVTVFYCDTVMLGFLRSNEDVGYYNAANKIIMFLIVLSGAYYDAIFPQLSNYYKTLLESFRRLLQLSTKLMVSLALPLATGGIILARPLMHLLYGVGYHKGIIAFQILIWTVAIIWVSGAYSRGLLGSDRQKRYLLGHTGAVVVNVIFNFILIPRFGLAGAASASVLAHCVTCTFFYIELKKVVKISLIKNIIKPFFSSLIMGFFIFWGLNFYNLSVFVLIFGGAIVYFITLFLLRGITIGEIRLIRNMLLANGIKK